MKSRQEVMKSGIFLSGEILKNQVDLAVTFIFKWQFFSSYMAQTKSFNH